MLKSGVPAKTRGVLYAVRQYFANVVYRNTEEDWFAPQVFTRAMEFLEVAKEGQPFFFGGGRLRPPRTVGSSR